MNSAQFITLAPVLAALALVLAPVSWAATIVALTAKREERAQRDLAREALTRAALAESALVDIRQRRSAATSRGNRTRAAAQRQLVLNTAAQMRIDMAAKQLPPQPEFPFPTSQTGDYHG